MSNTLTAGLFTFSDITVSGPGSADVTWSASTQSSSEYGGISSITFSDNGATVPITNGHDTLIFSYSVSYDGVDPNPAFTTVLYNMNISQTPNFLGGSVYNDLIECTSPSSCGGGASGYSASGVVGFIDNPYDELLGIDFTSFQISGSITFESGSTGQGEFTTTFAALDAPEPASLGLCAVSFGMLLMAAFGRSCVRR